MSKVRKAGLGIGLLVGLTASGLGSSPAQAEEAPAFTPLAPGAEVPVDHEPEARPDRHWYGWQVLGADMLAAGATVGCVKLDGGLPCALPFALGGSFVHAAHGNYGRAALSLAARVALPSLGMLVGGAATKKMEPCDAPTGANGGTSMFVDCPITYGSGTGVGALVGIVAAAAIDAALAYEDAPPPRVARRPPAVLPTMAVGQTDAVVGLQGRF
jgi:hypothetical protein